MAERATADRVAADMRPPDFRGAVQRLRTIKAKKEKIGSVNGEIADIYAKVEGLKVNKRSARIFIALDPLEGPDRADVWRGLVGLIEAAGWEEETDLVDRAEDKVVDFKTRGGKAQAKAGETDQGVPQDAEDLAQEIEAESTPAKRASLTAAEARERVKQHFAQGEAPPANESGEPYTGDNSDLAGGE